MSHVLKLLGKGLDVSLEDLLADHLSVCPTDTVEQLTDQCDLEPKSGDLLFRLGLAHLSARRYEEAVMHLAQAISCQPGHQGAHVGLAIVHDAIGNLSRALDHLESASRVTAPQAELLFAMGLFCERLGRTSQAGRHYKELLKVDSTYAAARHRLAAIAIFGGEFDDAIEQYHICLDDEPGLAWVRSGLGHLYFLAGLYGPAIEQFQTTIAMQPDNWALGDDQIEQMVSDGYVEDAIDHIVAMLEQQGPFTDLHARLGDLYGKVGRDDEAVEQYHAALDIEPEYMEAMIKLGTHHLINGRWTEAAESLNRASQMNDDLLLNYVGTAVAQMADGNVEAAENTLELAAAVEPNGTLLLTETVRLQEKAFGDDQCDPSSALEMPVTMDDVDIFNESLLRKQIVRHREHVSMRPEVADLRYRYGILLRYEGRTSEASEQFEKALELSRSYTNAAIRLAFCRAELGRKKLGWTTLKNALNVPASAIDLHYRLGLMYADSDKFENAIRQIETADETTDESAAHTSDSEKVRANSVLSLQNMGLVDGVSATWRSLCRINQG